MYGKKALHMYTILQEKFDKVNSVIDQSIHHGLFQRSFLEINKIWQA